MTISIKKESYKKICQAESVYTAAVSGAYWNMKKEDVINLIAVIGDLLSEAKEGVEE